jgi:hypothetical protein
LKTTKDNLVATVVAETYTISECSRCCGADPKLKNEFVLLSGHQDHDGVRQKIWSGLDI